MKLFYTKGSPYASKVRMAAALKQVELELQEVVVAEKTDDWLAVNPLGKIPALALDDGTNLFDSRVIVEYLDQMSEGVALIPENEADQFQVKTIAALADGICDAFLMILFEKRRSEEKQSEGIYQWQRKKVNDAIDYLNKNIGLLDQYKRTIAPYAVMCALDFGERIEANRDWQKRAETLSKWYEEIRNQDFATSILLPRDMVHS